MSAQTTPAPSVSANDPLAAQLCVVITDLRSVVDSHLDQLIRSRAHAPEVVHGLAQLEGLLDIFGAYAESWRPSDVLSALHDDLSSFIAASEASLDLPSLGAYLKTDLGGDLSGPDGVRLETSPGPDETLTELDVTQ